MGREFGKLLVEVCAVLGVIGGAVALRRWRFAQQIGVIPAAAGAIALVTVVLTLANLHDTGGVLNHARRDSVGGRVGLEHCFSETNGEPGPQLPLRLPFINWVKRGLPSQAVYALAPSVGPPDAWCVALVLLPALPARFGQLFHWVVTFGTVAPGLEAWFVRHRWSVRVFAPGFALAHDGAQ
jgi:hypothetical protein